jgi:hypothetical protein
MPTLAASCRGDTGETARSGEACVALWSALRVRLPVSFALNVVAQARRNVFGATL